MLRPDSPRLLLLLPTGTYRTVAFIEAARSLGVAVTVASERPSAFERANPAGLVTFDFADPAHAAEQARAFARTHLVHGVVAVDDDTAVVAAAIAEELGLRGNPVAAARAARDKHRQRQLLAAAGVAGAPLARPPPPPGPRPGARGAPRPGFGKGRTPAGARHNHRGAWLIELAARPIGGRCSGALRFDTRETGKGKGETLSLEEIIIRHALDMPIPTLEREAQASGVMMIPVPGPGVLRDVRGVNAAGAVPLLESVEI